ncbi:MAG: hypothetical protein RJQ14_14395 [Marinoscillum sp.]
MKTIKSKFNILMVLLALAGISCLTSCQDDFEEVQTNLEDTRYDGTGEDDNGGDGGTPPPPPSGG